MNPPEEAIIEKIKKKGYWQFLFQPLYERTPFPLGELKEKVLNSVFGLKGSNFPKAYMGEIKERGEFIEGERKGIGWRDFWRFWRDGRFICYAGLDEDWDRHYKRECIEDALKRSFELKEYLRGMKESERKKFLKELKDRGVLSVTSGILATLIRVFRFLKCLVEEKVYEGKVKVKIKLGNIKGKLLVETDEERGPLQGIYKGKDEEVEWETTIEGEELEDWRDLVIGAMKRIVSAFGWHNPPEDIWRGDIERLMEGKM